MLKSRYRKVIIGSRTTISKIVKMLGRTVICLVGGERIGEVLWYSSLDFKLNQTKTNFIGIFTILLNPIVA